MNARTLRSEAGRMIDGNICFVCRELIKEDDGETFSRCGIRVHRGKCSDHVIECGRKPERAGSVSRRITWRSSHRVRALAAAGWSGSPVAGAVAYRAGGTPSVASVTLKRWLKKRKMKQSKFALLVEISDSSLSHYLSGSQVPRPFVRARIARLTAAQDGDVIQERDWTTPFQNRV